jgi:hypothetical protein
MHSMTDVSRGTKRSPERRLQPGLAAPLKLHQGAFLADDLMHVHLGAKPEQNCL